MNRLKDKVIVVTGGSGLLGMNFLQKLRSEGAITINADISRKDGEEGDFVFCDITSQASIDETIKTVQSRYGRIDGLVNNAYPRTKDWGSKFEDISLESWKTNVDWQMNSYFYFSQQVTAGMKERRSGAIVNIASIYGVVGPDFTIYEGTPMTNPAAYAAIKGGLISLTRYLAAYLGPYHIRVNAVSPGGIFDHQLETFVKHYEEKVPMKRMGTPDDISPAVAFLLSDEAGYITGQNLVVDGGWTIV
jgi:NAD(P)-dependent dehydrogenase (short-subunit alcohol dehydrogenase family)